MQRILTVSAIMMMAACASTSQPAATTDSAAAASDGMTVVAVQNNVAAARDVIIYLEPEGRGERQNLGTVGAGRTAEFSHDIPRGYYSLIAAHNLGETKSERFNLTAPSKVTWMMGANRVVVDRR